MENDGKMNVCLQTVDQFRDAVQIVIVWTLVILLGMPDIHNMIILFCLIIYSICIYIYTSHVCTDLQDRCAHNLHTDHRVTSDQLEG